jgi:hypothetical protein
MQITFGKKDGSLYVNFPYYKHTQGLVSRVTFPSNNVGPLNLSLEPGGKITSHLVKYAHHPDGQAHFSQDGRVLTAVKKQSLRLCEVEDHIFTVMLQGISNFSLADPKKDFGSNDKRTTLNFDFGLKLPEAIKIVGRWYSKISLQKRVQGSIKGPKVPCSTPKGKNYWGFLVDHPYGIAGQDYVLLLTCEAVPRLDKDRDSGLTFIGGFDSREITGDPTKEFTFLALSYPVSNANDLASRIGCIDLRKLGSPTSS